MPTHSTLHVRPATAPDAGACVEIYAPYVTGTSITFEVELPTVGEFAKRIADCRATHEWLVATRDGAVIGYAYGHRFAERAAYNWSCETSIYLAQSVHRQGVGRALYEQLLGELAAHGYRRAFAGITLPNDSSIGLHHAFGFQDAGYYRRVGWKDGIWHDVVWLQRDLQVAEIDPPPPISGESSAGRGRCSATANTDAPPAAREVH
jgi:L-amino acid N-acyltransferase YncA